MTRRWFVALAGASAAAGQTGRRRSATGSAGSVGSSGGAAALDVVFRGSLKSLGRKEFTLEMEEEQILTFAWSRKTVFRRGKQTIAAKDIPEGTLLTVEARREPNGVIQAVTVTIKESEGQEKPAEGKNP